MSKQQSVCPHANHRQASRFIHVVLAILAVTILFGTTTLAAQKQRQQAIVAEQAQPVVASATAPDVNARFSCELRPFSLSRGLFCYGPAAIRSAYGLSQLIANGSDGTGQTIVII